MEKLKKRIHDDSNGLDYILVGDYYIPDFQLREESLPIGRWGGMHKEYLQEHCPSQYNDLLLSGKLWTYLGDLNEQTQSRFEVIVSQMQDTEKVTKNLKCRDWIGWVQSVGNIRNRTEEIVRSEMIFI